MSIKPFDKPISVQVKEITAHVVAYADNNKQNLKTVIYPSALFEEAVSDPLSPLTTDTVAGKADFDGQNANQQVMQSCRNRCNYDADGNAIAWVGPATPLAMSGETFSHGQVNNGVNYKSKVYHINSILEQDAVVIDGMMITITATQSYALGAICRYVDTNDSDAEIGDICTIARPDTPGGVGDGTLRVIDDKGVDIVSQVVNTDPLWGSSATAATFKNSHSRIDPSDFTISSMWLGESDNGDVPVFCAIDVTITLKIYDKIVDGVKTRHVGILTAVPQDDGVDLPDSYSNRSAVTSTNYSEDYDYPARIAAQKSAKTGVAFNGFSNETYHLKSELVSNVPCSGRIYSTLRKNINVYGWDNNEPPNWVVVSTVWVDGDQSVDDDLADNDVNVVIASSTAEMIGTMALTYDMQGSRKFAYAFINGLRQFVTYKAVTGKNVVNYTANVDMRRPDVEIIKGSNIDPSEFSAAIDSFVSAGIVADTWIVNPTLQNIVTAMVYDDGDEIEVSEGLGAVIGGNFTVNFERSAWANNNNILSPDLAKYTATGIDAKHPQDLASLGVSVGYFNVDDKLVLASALNESVFFGSALASSVVSKSRDSYPPNTSTFPNSMLGHNVDNSSIVELTATRVNSIGDKSGSSAKFITENGQGVDLLHYPPNLGVTDLKECTTLSALHGVVIHSDTDAISADPLAIVQNVNRDSNFSTSTLWASLADAYAHYADNLYDGSFPTAFLLLGVPTPAVYRIAGQGVHGDEGGAPVGWRQFNPIALEWDIVWLDGGSAPNPIIVPSNGSIASVIDGDMGGDVAGVSYIYSEPEATWLVAFAAGSITPTYTEANLRAAEKVGGMVSTSTSYLSDLVFIFYQNKCTGYRQKITGTNKYLYSISHAKTGEEEVALVFNLAKLFVGDIDGNVIDDITTLPSNIGDIDITTLSANGDNNEIALGLAE